MGPRGRAIHEFATLTAGTLATDPELGPVQRLHTAFLYGFEVALALQAMDSDWTRDGLEQLGAWQQQKWGDAATEARQKVLKDTRVIRNLARGFGDP